MLDLFKDFQKMDLIWILFISLFTYAYEPVHDVIRYYSQRYKKARIVVGVICAKA